MIKVCVRVPEDKKEQLLEFAKELRELSDESNGPGWDAKVIHKIAREEFGGLEEMFETHEWPERGSDMMRQVQRHVKETYGSIKAFADEFVSTVD